MRRTLLLACSLLLGLPLSVAACLWDRDTPASEAKGLPEVVAVLTGRFERNPPLFYEMRLTRVSAHLQDHPDDLASLDDAAVACDRLGLGDEAIAWMEKKHAQLEKLDPSLPATRDHLYRYHANLGTFLVHRWARLGADRSHIDDVQSARDHIARALEINPDAHFGREKYQLLALDFILSPPPIEHPSHALPNLLGWSFDDIYGQSTDPKDADDAVRGLTGLVVLGNAWESVDIFHALNLALQRDSVGYERGREGGRNTLAYLAWLRCRELIDSGKGSLHPSAPRGEALKAVLPRPDFVEASRLLDPAFAKLRAEADAWHAARTAFMLTRLEQGLHPDTHLHFWNGYTSLPAPSLPTTSVPEAFHSWMRFRTRMAYLIVFGGPLLLIGLAIGLLKYLSARSRLRNRRPAGLDEPIL